MRALVRGLPEVFANRCGREIGQRGTVRVNLVLGKKLKRLLRRNSITPAIVPLPTCVCNAERGQDHPIGGVNCYAGAYDLQARLADSPTTLPCNQMFFGQSFNTFVITQVRRNRNKSLGLRFGPCSSFHARDDSNVPFQHAEEFVSELKQSPDKKRELL